MKTARSSVTSALGAFLVFTMLAAARSRNPEINSTRPGIPQTTLPTSCSSQMCSRCHDGGAHYRDAPDQVRVGRSAEQDDRAGRDRQRRRVPDRLRLPAPALRQGLHQHRGARRDHDDRWASRRRTRTPSSPTARRTAPSRISRPSRRSRTSTSRRSKSTKTRSRSEASPAAHGLVRRFVCHRKITVARSCQKDLSFRTPNTSRGGSRTL